MLQKTASLVRVNPAITTARARLTPVMRALCQWAVVDPGDRVLDVACGDGTLLNMLGRQASCQLCGISATNEQCRRARDTLPEADILFAQMEDIPWHSEGFDVVVCGMPIYQMENPGRVLGEILRVLKPGGQFVMAAPWYPAPLRQLVNRFSLKADEAAGPVCMGRHEASILLEQVGFEKVTWRQAELTAAVTVGWKPLADDLDRP